MPLPSGVTYVTVLNVEVFDDKTNKPTICFVKYDVDGIEYTDSINVGAGFLSNLNSLVSIRKKAVQSIAQAQNIINNKIS